MEKFFEITNKSSAYKEYFDYLERKEAAIKALMAFSIKYGIKQGDPCHVGRGTLYITDNQNNRENLGNMLLKKPNCYGLVKIRENSKAGKEWASLGVETPEKPFVPFFFNGMIRRSQTRIFHVGKKLYCSISSVECEDDAVSCPAGFIEMKGSEFHAVMEGIE